MSYNFKDNYKIFLLLYNLNNVKYIWVKIFGYILFDYVGNKEIVVRVIFRDR